MSFVSITNKKYRTLDDWHHVHKQSTIVFSSDSNPYGIPDLPPYNGPIPSRLVQYSDIGRMHDPEDRENAAVHFYEQDIKFESIWTRPGHALEKIQRFPCAVAPDFSVYESFPLAVKLWNKYRSHWCARFWVEEGMPVIPRVTWAGQGTIDVMFAGIPRQSIVSVASLGAVSNWEDKKWFKVLYETMLERIEPTGVLFFGNLPPNIPTEGYKLYHYNTKWKTHQMRSDLAQLYSGNNSLEQDI